MRINIGAFTLDTEVGFYLTGPRFELFAGERAERQPHHKFADYWREDGTAYIQFGSLEITASRLPVPALRDAGDDDAGEAAP